MQISTEDIDNCEDLRKLREERGYTYEDAVTCSRDKLPNYDEKVNKIAYRWQLKTLILSTNVDQKSLETEFSFAICRPTGDTWQSKTRFLAIFDPRSSIV